MTSTNMDNPLLKAASAAIAELTTPEAQRWYGRQIQQIGGVVQAIALRGLGIIQGLLGSRRSGANIPVQAIALPESESDLFGGGVIEVDDALPDEAERSWGDETAEADASFFTSEETDAEEGH